MFKEFKEFAMRGNVVDMAVGIIIGAAFGTIVKSLVADVLMPPIGLLLGNVDFSNLFVVIKQGAAAGPYLSLDAAKEAGAVTLNYGVDISAKNDMNVRCVADGVISAIDWLPGYGSVIIVTHKGDYRTVYSHLSEIFVDEGEEIKAGKVIAKIGDSLEGKVLHFEIWNSRENQNPELWLAHK